MFNVSDHFLGGGGGALLFVDGGGGGINLGLGGY
jgi:hypothetical protein